VKAMMEIKAKSLITLGKMTKKEYLVETYKKALAEL
jgi:hypothetical protein